MVQYRPMTESFRELNRMITEKTAWDAQHEANAAQQGIKNMMIEGQLEGQRQQQELMQYKLAEQEKFHTPKIIDLGRINQGGNEGMKDILKDPETIKRITSHLDPDGIGYTFDKATKKWEHPVTGEPLRLSNFQMQDVAPAIFGEIDNVTDSVSGVYKNLPIINKQIESYKSDMAALRKDPRNKQELVRMHETLQGLKDKKKEHEHFLTNDGLLTHYGSKKIRQQKRAQYYRQLGDEQKAKAMDGYAATAAVNENAILKKVLDGGSGTGKMSSPQKLFAQVDTVHNGKEYKAGDVRIERFNAGQKEISPGSDWNTKSPFDTEGERAAYNTASAMKGFAEAVKRGGPFGDMTTGSAADKRDTLQSVFGRIRKMMKIPINGDVLDAFNATKDFVDSQEKQYFTQRNHYRRMESEDVVKLMKQAYTPKQLQTLVERVYGKAGVPKAFFKSGSGEFEAAAKTLIEADLLYNFKNTIRSEVGLPPSTPIYTPSLLLEQTKQ